MPCTTVHLSFADRALTHWGGQPASAPIDLKDARVRQAFLQGSVGPDMGFMPRSGAFRFVSELAHYRRPADLVKALMERARTPLQRAYAWGWLTHVLVDVELHPVVGHACGELILGDRETRMNAIDSSMTHMSLEVGIDLRLARLDPGLPGIDPRSGLPAAELGFVVEAYDATYGRTLPRAAFEYGHERSLWLNAAWPWILRTVASPVSVPERSLARLAAAVVGRQGPAAATLSPIDPPEWVLERFLEARAAFPEQLVEVFDAGLDSLENRNLETGAPGETDMAHPPSVSVRDRLVAVTSVA